MSRIADLAQAQLRKRAIIEQDVVDIITSRCDYGQGRVCKGALQYYIHRHLGFHGIPSHAFCRFIDRVVVEQGARIVFLHGKQSYYGVFWRGEARSDWRKPLATDIPRWGSNKAKFIIPDDEV